MGEIKQDSRRSSVSCCVVKPPFCTLSTSPLGLVSSLQNLQKRKYRKNTWLFEFENKHFPCFMSLYILKTEQKKTESIIKYEFFFVHVNRRIALHFSLQPPVKSTSASQYCNKTKPLSKVTEVFDNSGDFKQKNGYPKSI